MSGRFQTALEKEVCRAKEGVGSEREVVAAARKGRISKALATRAANRAAQLGEADQKIPEPMTWAQAAQDFPQYEDRLPLLKGVWEATPEAERSALVDSVVHTFWLYTALHFAAENGRLDTVRWLCTTAGANVEVRTSDLTLQRTPLVLAASHGHASVVQALIDEFHADVEVANQFGWRPLHWAASYGKANVVEVLLARGADASAVTTRNEGLDYDPDDPEDDRGVDAGWTPRRIAEHRKNNMLVDLFDTFAAKSAGTTAAAAPK